MTVQKCEISKTFNGYFAKVDHVPDGTLKTATVPKMIVVLDRSGSMGQHVSRLVCNILPKFFALMGYDPNLPMELITFDSYTEHLTLLIKDLPEYKIDARGCTEMSGVAAKLENVLVPGGAYNILTLSDGDVYDAQVTQVNASNLAKKLQGLDLSIDSQAVRYGTGGSPDTRALASLLQLNSMGSATVVDIQAGENFDEIAQQLASLFQNNALSKFTVTGCGLKTHPWRSATVDSVYLKPGMNMIWLNNVPTEAFIDDTPIQTEVNDKSALFSAKDIDNIFTHARILRVIGTTDSLDEIKEMIAYFDQLEKFLDNQVDAVETDATSTILGKRRRALIETINKRRKSVKHALAAIFNDSQIGKLNSAQQANYLRNQIDGKNARALAKRAATDGEFDFDRVVQKEVLNMHQHLNELADIDDSDHSTSFVSFDTTLGGIKAVCQLVDNGILESCSALDVLELLNVVGIPVEATVGDYPDPMTYRINQIHYDCFASTSDLLVAWREDVEIVTPGTKRKFDNVVPIFEDERILWFLKKHAPSMFDFIGSLGMRKLMADVSMTMGYTMIAGVWKLVEEITKNPTEIACRHFLTLTSNVKTYTKYFAFANEALERNSGSDDMCFNLSNNGVTNLIVPMLASFGNGVDLPLSRIVRAFYTFEIWAAVKKLYRHQENGDDIVDRMLKKLFLLDDDNIKVEIKPLFEPEPEEPRFALEHGFNREYVEELLKPCWYVNYVAVCPLLLKIAAGNQSQEDKIAALKNVVWNEQELLKVLDVTDLQKFNFLNVLQALKFATKKCRIDETTGECLLPDVGIPSMAENLVKDSVRAIYLDKYNNLCQQKSKQESTILDNDLAERLINATEMHEYLQLLKDGISKGTRSLKLDVRDPAFKLVEAGLFGEKNIPLQVEKVLVFVKGRHGENDEIVWNNGNLLRAQFALANQFLERLGLIEVQESLRAYAKHLAYIYRGKENRHGHSNEKPSYWAFGFNTLEAYRQAMGEEQFKEYAALHVGCCGL